MMNADTFDTLYMFQNSWTQDYRKLYDSINRIEETPYLTIVDNALVLPTKPSDELSWGWGGVMDGNDNFVKKSAVGKNAYGEAVLKGIGNKGA